MDPKQCNIKGLHCRMQTRECSPKVRVIGILVPEDFIEDFTIFGLYAPSLVLVQSTGLTRN